MHLETRLLACSLPYRIMPSIQELMADVDEATSLVRADFTMKSELEQTLKTLKKSLVFLNESRMQINGVPWLYFSQKSEIVAKSFELTDMIQGAYDILTEKLSNAKIDLKKNRNMLRSAKDCLKRKRPQEAKATEKEKGKVKRVQRKGKGKGKGKSKTGQH